MTDTPRDETPAWADGSDEAMDLRSYQKVPTAPRRDVSDEDLAAARIQAIHRGRKARKEAKTTTAAPNSALDAAAHTGEAAATPA